MTLTTDFGVNKHYASERSKIAKGLLDNEKELQALNKDKAEELEAEQVKSKANLTMTSIKFKTVEKACVKEAEILGD